MRCAIITSLVNGKRVVKNLIPAADYDNPPAWVGQAVLYKIGEFKITAHPQPVEQAFQLVAARPSSRKLKAYAAAPAKKPFLLPFQIVN
jgi:hypothetical protein